MENRKLKILQAVYCLGRGGAEKLAIDITRQLASYEDVEVLLISFDKTVDYEYSTEDINYKFCPANVRLSLLGTSQKEIENYVDVVKNFKPDIIHSHRYLAEVITREYVEKDIVYFTHCHDNIVQFQNFSCTTLFYKKRLTNYFERLRLFIRYKSCNNFFIAISKDTKKYFTNVLPPKLQGNMYLLYNAINFKQLNSLSWNRSLKSVNLINVGNFSIKKNQIFLVEVMRHLRSMKVEANLTFLGDGTELEKVQEAVNSYGLNNSVHFAGNVSNVSDYLKEANLYVHSAFYEPFGLVLLEAMAIGLPVVAIDGKGNRDIVFDDKNGYMVEADAAIFAKKISSIFKDEARYTQLSENAKRFAAEYDINLYTDKLLKIYRDAVLKASG